MTLMPVDQALETIIANVRVTGGEPVALHDAPGRVLAQDLQAKRDQPPCAVSAMDGYAVRAGDIASGAPLRVVGEAAAGHDCALRVGAGQAVRIFTGAPMPAGADTVLIQENALLRGDGGDEGNEVRAAGPVPRGRFVRPAGLDFKAGTVLLHRNTRLGPAAVALAASMNYAHLCVRRRPLVAILASGDELVPAGAQPAAGQIIASNTYGVAAYARAAGACVLDLGIAGDRLEALLDGFARAREREADVLVTLGGASVGDHDLVLPALRRFGITPKFRKIASRPGKPLLYAHEHGLHVLGLPGNPVSSMVTALVFLQPLILALLGLSPRLLRCTALLGRDVAANDERQEYMRASVTTNTHGQRIATPFERQDSAMLAVFARADALVVRPANAAPAKAGERCTIIPLEPPGFSHPGQVG